MILSRLFLGHRAVSHVLLRATRGLLRSHGVAQRTEGRFAWDTTLRGSLLCFCRKEHES